MVLVPAIAEKPNSLMAMMAKLKSGLVTFTVDGMDVELSEADVLVESSDKEGYGWRRRRYNRRPRYQVTPELIEEGFVREIINKIQTMRKEAGFEVTDHIRVFYAGNPQIAGIMDNNRETIAGEVLGDEIKEGTAEGYSKEWNINGENVTVTVAKV